MQCSAPARPHSYEAPVHYFEVLVKEAAVKNSFLIGYTDENHPSTKPPGHTKKSYAVKADGKIYHNGHTSDLYLPKINTGDVVGIGISYDKKQIFVTLNGLLQGIAFQNVEIRDYYPTIALMNHRESLMCNFTGPYMFDLKALIAEEEGTYMNSLMEEPVDHWQMHQLVHNYLQYYGYYNTLNSFVKSSGMNSAPEKILTPDMKRRTSSRLSEVVGTMDLDVGCIMCEEKGKLCEECLHSIFVQVEPTNPIKLPWSRPNSRHNSVDNLGRDRYDSVDLSYFYLKSDDMQIETEQKVDPQYFKEIQERSELRNVILTGNIPKAQEIVAQKYPQLLNNPICMLNLSIQQFIEIIRSNDPYAALDYAREHLARYRNEMITVRKDTDIQVPVIEAVGLLCYNHPEVSCLGYLLANTQRELCADVVNEAIYEYQTEKHKCLLEILLKQLVVTHKVYGEQQLLFDSENVRLNI